MRGPLGALPSLSPAARRAVLGCGLLAAGNAVALAVAAWALSATLSGRPLLGVFGVAVLARALLGWAGQTVAARAAAGAKEDLRAHLLDGALRHGPEWIDERHPAELTALATTGLDALDDYFTRFLPAMVGAAVTVPLAGLVILLADWRSAVIVAVTVPLVPLFAALIGRFTEGRVATAADASARLAAHLLELVRALPVLTAFGRAAAQAGAVAAESERHRVATRTTLRVAFLSAFALDVIATLSVALVAVDVGLRLLAGHVGLGTALLVLILAPECYLPLRAAGAAFHASEDGLEAAARVATIVGAEGQPVPEGVRPAGLRHQLDITGLRVRRRDRDAPAGLTVRVRPGEITRIDSPSGTGKSTTFAVLLGFVAPTAGTVTVDGTDLSILDTEEWRRQVAWVPQRPRFTAATVEAELRLAAPGADPADVAGALLHRRIDTLSSGERQRVALARALLRLRQGAWLLLLDEPTAHLDHATAAHVTAAIEQAATAGAAVLLATHTGLVHEPLTDQRSAPVVPVAEAHATRPVRLRALVSPRLLAGALLGALALGSAVALTATAAWLITRAAAHPSIVVLTVAVIAVRAFGLGKGVLRYAERLVSHDAAFRLAGRLRVRLWTALTRLGPVRAARLGDGQRRLVADVDTVRDLVPRVLTPPLTALLVGAGAVALETALYPPAGVALCVALLVAGLAGPLAGLAAERRATRILAGGRREVAGAVLGLLDAAADLLATGAHRVRRAELARLDATLAATARRQAWGAGVTTAIGIAALGAAALAGAWLSTGHVNPVDTTVLALVPLALAETVDGLGPALRHLDPLRAAYGRITELDTPVPVRSTPDGPVDLANVSVTWPGATEPALRDVTLTLRPGVETAVMGPSGAGKSTLLALLLGFLPPTGQATIPAAVAWCPPEPYLSATTVRENLRLADPTADDATLRAALHTVALDDWHLDTRLGQAGTGTSGGEAQRLSLARTLLRARHADLILLDEPTAHLDAPTAHRVLAALRTELAGKTIVHVTHRPADAQAAATVLRVTEGRVSTPETVSA
jgi:thiol reductant ABC exporter CydD subunit/thiol reductant ABC exporter CydC subunit